jgi:hypothetical protein
VKPPVQTICEEPRWPPALAILAVLVLVALLPHHVHVLPVWVSWVAAFAVLVPMAAVTLTRANPRWLRIERTTIVLLALTYVANTSVELADMIGIITVHPPETRAISLLSASVAIWVSTVLVFSLLYWQIDRGGPAGRASPSSPKPDWVFPQPASPEDVPPGCQPFFLDYLSLGFNTATAFSPTDAMPLTHRAKMLMMIESAISLLTIAIVVSYDVGVLQ